MNKDFNSIRYKDDFPLDAVERIRIKKALKLIGSGKKVLDIGCGDGFISEMIRDNQNKVSGIEIAENAIKKCKKKGIQVYDLDLNSDWQKKLKGKFDVIYSGEIIEHIFDTDKFLKNIHRTLKKGGELVIDTPNVASFGRRIFLAFGISPLIETTARSYDAGHIRYFTFKTLKKLLNENGFRVDCHTTDCVNFDRNGKVKSVLLAKIFPSIGRSLILKCSISDEK